MGVCESYYSFSRKRRIPVLYSSTFGWSNGLISKRYPRSATSSIFPWSQYPISYGVSVESSYEYTGTFLVISADLNPSAPDRIIFQKDFPRISGRIFINGDSRITCSSVPVSSTIAIDRSSEWAISSWATEVPSAFSFPILSARSWRYHLPRFSSFFEKNQCWKRFLFGNSLYNQRATLVLWWFSGSIRKSSIAFCAHRINSFVSIPINVSGNIPTFVNTLYLPPTIFGIWSRFHHSSSARRSSLELRSEIVTISIWFLYFAINIL